MAKDSKRNVTEVVQSLEIGSPYEVEHKLNVKFDEEQLRFSGIPEDWNSVAHKQFGTPLSSVPRAGVLGYTDRIPVILIKLRMRLEELDGLAAEGIFRLAPSGAESTDVKQSINAGDAMASLQTTRDPHVVANLIKQFFRELEPNLLNVLHRDKILEFADLEDADEIGHAVAGLPEPQQSCFLWLLDLLADVAANVGTNRMSPKNLAIVISPNLFDAGEQVAPMEALVLSQKVAQLVSNVLMWRIDTRGSAGEA